MWNVFAGWLNRGMRLAASGLMIVLCVAVSPGCAAVIEANANGFAIEETVHIAVPPDKVYAALTKPAEWWNADHTFSGNAANLSMDARAGGCLCEALPGGGSAQHLTVVFAAPGRTLRLRGAMGPFQGQGMDGSLTFALAAKDGGTDLVLDNNMGGFMKGGLGKWPAAADGMLTDLVAHLKAYCEKVKG